MLKKIFYSRFFAGAIFGTLALTLLSTGGNRYLEISKNMEIFAEVYKTVNYDYVEDVDANALMRTAIDSMLNDLDPYTNFFSEAQMEQLRIDVVGGWDGIGIETESRNGEIVVRDVVEETPAMQENIRIGDVIRSVDGKSTQGKKSRRCR
jgi:carboxyl-terminal processing protease